MPLVYVILVNYNNYSDTIECIESLLDINYNNFRILVIDNFSSNNSVEVLKERFDNIKIVKNKSNDGFAKANNIGINIALKEKAEYVVLLNNDTIVDKNFLIELVSFSKEIGDESLLTSRIYYNDEKDLLWYDGGEVDWNRFLGVHTNKGKKSSLKKEIREVSFASGCCMFIPKKLLESVGGLPEDYFMYFEDLDYCINLSKKGYKIYYNNQSIIYHKVSASSKNISNFTIKWGNRNRIILINKYSKEFKRLKILKIKLIFYLSRLAVILKYILSGKFSAVNSLIIGITDGIKYSKNNYLKSK